LKIFEIRDNNKIYAYLFANSLYSDYYIEILDCDDLDIFFKLFRDKNILVLNNESTKAFINERVIPSNRQNIKDILKEANFLEYNELDLFVEAKGKSSMDDLHIREIDYDDINENIKERRKHLIKDFMYDNNHLIVFFDDNSAISYEIEEDRRKYIKNVYPFICDLNYEIIFNSKIRYTYEYLYKFGKRIDISFNIIDNYLKNHLLTGKEIEEKYHYSRQYINKLKNDNIIKQVKKDIYLKSDINSFFNTK